MAKLQIESVIQGNGCTADQRIEWISGPGFHFSMQGAIEYMEANIHSFWAMIGGVVFDIVVATSIHGKKYLRTMSGNVISDELLYLCNIDEC